ncbi:MAG: hypothetical protein KQI81_17595 [Deltaproteobacteria bacterium]|nr:hypothetical protein [Deltaproteobacteria bacterium]
MAVTVRLGVVNGYTDERRTPKAKSSKSLSQVVQLVNDDCRLNRDGEHLSPRLRQRVEANGKSIVPKEDPLPEFSRGKGSMVQGAVFRPETKK